MSYIVPQKMPLRCFECGHISLSTMAGYGCKIAHKSLESEPGINVRRPDWCPLVEIPTPHGRLGDLDNIYVDGEGYFWFSENEAPTIIEAEE